MKFSIKKNIILEQLINVSKAISTRNIIPILNGIKFDLDKDGLSLMASDSDLTIKSTINAKDIESIDEVGSIIIQSKYILDIIKKMPSDIINFEVVDGLKIMIYTETSQYNLNCLNSLDYPNIDLNKSENPVVLKTSELKKMIRQTIFAISTQESRPLLTGLNIKVMGNMLEIVATDSYRLAKKTFKLDNNYDEMINIVVPGKNMAELDKILEDNDDLVNMHVFTNKILFEYKDILLQSNLLNGQYPNTDSFIPSEFVHIITANLEEFYSSIDRAALLTQSKEKNIVKMELLENEIKVSSYASEIGKVEDRISVKRNNNEDASISFSAKYMMDALRTLESEEIIIFMNSDAKPIVIKNANDESLIQLILPIKTY